MAREWQQTKMTEYLLPEAVYYQSLWAVRDYLRMKERLEYITSDVASGGSKSFVKESAAKYGDARPVEERALEIAILNERVDGIKKALMQVPNEYRSFIVSNIVMRNDGKAFGNKAWRPWKQKFLYLVAKNLSLF